MSVVSSVRKNHRPMERHRDPGKDPCKYAQLICTEVQNQSKGGKIVFSTNGAEQTSKDKKIDLNLTSHLVQKLIDPRSNIKL